jgi:NADPH:quinone reductase-like Zn-dependent oxidoreductase
MMKAIVYRRYGSPDVLALEEAERPAVADDQVQVRVRATSVNAYDWHMLRGKPYIARLSEGLRKPKTHTLGVDVAGIVEVAGSNVIHLKPGDNVFGSRLGGFAEYVSGRTFVPMPRGLTFEQAAAVPVAGCTALQALRDKGQLQPGQRVLINGAGGGVGTFAVQIAKALGGNVTGVTSTRNADTVRSIGADHVIDYTREDFTRSGRRYDLVIDVGGNRSLSVLARRVLTPEGTLILVAPGGGQWLGPVARPLAAVVRSRLGRRRMLAFLAKVTKEDLLFLKELIEAGQLTPVIDRTYRLSETADAIRHVEEGRSNGKVVITV